MRSKSEREISFKRIVVALDEGHLLDVLDHPNIEKYKNQKILIVDIEGYLIYVPFVEEKNGDLFMKTLFPSRKHTKQFNPEEKDEQD